MSIDLTTKFKPYTDEQFSTESKRSLLTNQDFNWTGARTVKVYKIGTAKMNNYNRKGDDENGFISRFGEIQHLDAITEPRLAHCDLWAGNVLIETAGGNYRVCAIIDGDRAMFGDPALDFAAGWMTTPEFLEGYGVTTDISSADSARRAVYSLFFRLQDAYIWKIEYNRDDFFEEALRTAEKILET